MLLLLRCQDEIYFYLLIYLLKFVNCRKYNRFKTIHNLENVQKIVIYYNISIDYFIGYLLQLHTFFDFPIFFFVWM